MTITTRQITQQEITQHYAERITRRIGPLIVAFAILFALVGMAIIFTSTRDRLDTDHIAGLERASTGLDARLQAYVQDALDMAADTRLRGLVASGAVNSLLRTDVILAFQRASDLIRDAEGEYEAIRYLDNSGRVVLETVDRSGVPVVTPTEDLGATINTQVVNDPGFLALANMQSDLVSVGRFYETLNPNGLSYDPPRVQFSVYAPVVVDNAQVGVVQLAVDGTQLLDVVNQADLNFFTTQDLSGRRIILVNEQGVLADSGAARTDYLRALESDTSNMVGNPLYEVLARVGSANATLTTELEGQYLVSGQPLLYTGLPTLEWQLFLVDDFFEAYAPSILTAILASVLSAVLALVMILSLQRLLTAILRPYVQAEQLVAGLANDDLDLPATNPQQPSTSAVAPIIASAERLIEKMSQMSDELDAQVFKRGRDLQVAGRIGREIATLTDLNLLLKRAINLICLELEFYHGQVFLIDDIGRYAVLRSSRGEAGERLLKQGHRIQVGSPTIIGTVTGDRRPVIVNDTGVRQADVQHGFNPLLPDTRAEMGLPLIVGDQIIGALDLQSKEANVFLNEDIPIFQLVADQLAIAIYNAQLRQQTEQRMAQINRMNRQLIREGWQPIQAGAIQAVGDVRAANGGQAVTAPISIRGEVIGSLQVAPDTPLSEGDQMVLNAVAERVSLAIENARLFEQTQLSLAETSTLYELTRKLNEADKLLDILRAIVETVARDANSAQIWVFNDRVSSGEVPRLAHLRADLPLTTAGNQPLWPEATTLVLADHPVLQDLRSDRVMVLQYIEQTPSFEATLVAQLQARSVQALTLVPISTRNTWRGFISITFAQPRTLTESEYRVYQALVGQAGVAIDNRLLLIQTEEALLRSEKLYVGSRIINTMQNLQDLVYAALATSNYPELNFWLALLEGDSDNTGWPNRARVVAQTRDGVVEETNLIHNVFVPQDSPLRRGEIEIVRLPDDPDMTLTQPQEWVVELGLSFMAILPMFSNRVPLALFYIVSEQDFTLSEQDIELYASLTRQMSTQIENTRLLRRTADALGETRRLYAAGRAIANATTMEDIYEAVAGHLALPFVQATDRDVLISVSLLLAVPRPTVSAAELEYAYQWVSDPMRRQPAQVGDRVDHREAPFAMLLENSDEGLLVYHDLAHDLMDFPAVREVLEQHQAVSAAVAPLRSSNKWFGVLIVRADVASVLSDSYVRFLQGISSRIATAIERQQLLRQTDEERRRLDSILQALPTGVVVLDPVTFVPVAANQRAAVLLNQPINFSEPFEARRYSLYRTGTAMFYPDDELPVQSALLVGDTASQDDVAVNMEGYQVDMLMSAAPIYNADGSVSAIVTSLEDISSLRNLENTLHEKLREQVFYLETQRALTEARSLDELLDAVMTPLMMQQPTDAFVLLDDERTETLVLARYMAQPLTGIEALRPILGTEMLLIDDIETSDYVDEFMADVFNQIPARSALVTPLRTPRGASLGWMLIVGDEPDAFALDQQRMLNSVSDMASTAIDNNFLSQRQQSTLTELASLYSATSSISRARDLDDLGYALQSALQPLHADMIAGYVMTEQGPIELFNEGFEASVEQGLRFERLLTADIPLVEGTYVADITRSTLSPLESELIRGGNIMAFAAINLRIKDLPGGRLFVGYSSPHDFSESQTRLLSTIADSASIVVDNLLLVEQIQANLQEASMLYQVSKEINKVSHVEEIIDVIVNHLIDSHINQVFIAMLSTPSWDTPGASVEVVASWQSENDVDLKGVTLTPEQFPAWSQLSTPTVLTINDIYDPESGLDPLEQTSIESLDTRSLVVIPLGVPKRAIGAIWLGSREPHHYTESDRRVFQPFAEQTSLSLEAARALALSNRRSRQLVTSAQIGRDIVQILDLKPLLSRVVNLIQESFGYDHVQVFLMDTTDENAELVASTGEAGIQLLAINHSLPVGSESVIGRVTATKQPAIALDTADANVVHQPNPYLPLTRSELALPLIVKGRIVGALDVQSNQPNAFGEEDLQALETLAAQISVAIDNASLYQDTQRSAREIGFLFELTTAAAAADTLQDALTLITDKLLEEINAINATIYMPRLYADYQENIVVTLVPEASSGTGQPLAELTELNLTDSENLVAIVGSTLSPQIVPVAHDEPRYVPIADTARSAIITPIASGGKLIGVLLLESDQAMAFTRRTVTLLQTLNGSLAAVIQNSLLVDQLQRSNDQLREIDRFRSQFLANMSHELRTPLNSIIGFSRVMLKGIDGPLTEMQEQDLTTIHRSGNLLLTLINEILDQAKIESGELNLKFGYFELEPVIETVRSIGLGLVKEKPIELKAEIAPNLPKAFGDEFRTRQILNNLVGNATKFTPEGEIRIQAYTYQDNQGHPYLRVDVIDTGIGIEEKDIPTIFEQFRQVDSSLTRTAGGTGLGLPLAKSLAEMQGGAILVDSTPGVGSTFSLLIPTETGAEELFEQRQQREKVERERQREQIGYQLGRSKQRDAERAEEAANAKNEAEAKRATSETRETQAIPALMMSQQRRLVLLIEDNRDMVDQFRRILQREGFEVQTADFAAYARAMVSQLRPTVVIMDVNFEGGVGWDILRDLKDQDDTFDIPIIISTLNADSERAYRLGAFRYLQRPSLPEALVEAVLEAEKESQRQRILIIDDQPNDIRLLTQILGDNGNFRVFSAETGLQGISMVARHRPDLVILDLRMPGMDGFAVLQELRKNPETASIPVLIVTGDADFNSDEAAQLRNVRVLRKTDITQEEYDELLQSIRSQLHGNQGDSGD